VLLALINPVYALAEAAREVSLEGWSRTLPFSFKYDGRDSATLLANWQRSVEVESRSDGQIHRYTFVDPATHLKVAAEVRTFAAFDAIDWVLNFSNEGNADTPIIEDIQPLSWTLDSGRGPVLHSARGSDALPEDFEPLTNLLQPGRTLAMGSAGGRSSSTTNLPFFNLQLENGGVIGAIGWTGDWSASFAADKTSTNVALRAGMKRTHLRLHPGETIRSPRIVLLRWHGQDWQVAQNLWRRLVFTHYAPQVDGHPVVGPVAYCTWGAESIEKKLAQLKMVQTAKLPFDVYWIDAGWYGHSDGEGDEGPSPWWRNRGSWFVNPVLFPQGLKPMADAVRATNLKFLLWFEPEEADPDTTLRAEHPEWFFLPPNANNPGTAILNLGDPAARQGITALVSKIITDTGLSWYRQDFNASPDRSWAANDTPDRIGMSEIKHIEGLYAMWDDLCARHPGLLIDNCASGGRRLDLEAMSRSFALTRSDLAGPWTDPVGGQRQTQGLSPWVPLNAHGAWLWSSPTLPPFDDAFLYFLRSGYSTAYAPYLGVTEGKTADWLGKLKLLLEEYRAVQPFLYGDFYPLAPYSPEASAFASTQWDRPDLRAGVVLVFRRADCPSSAVDLSLRAIEPDARYDVEIRTGLEKDRTREMSGRELAALHLVIDSRPGSAVILYHRR
jgi:alpha-galactosidase